VRDWENDISEPRANKLQMVAGVLNVSLTWLLAGEGEGLAAPAEAGALADHDAQKVLAEIRQLRSEIARSADRLAVLEKHLRKALSVQTA
jgi:transcriptional regulator with XRE-family HTH domain